jgi:hypothetical protein
MSIFSTVDQIEYSQGRGYDRQAAKDAASHKALKALLAQANE